MKGDVVIASENRVIVTVAVSAIHAYSSRVAKSQKPCGELEMVKFSYHSIS